MIRLVRHLATKPRAGVSGLLFASLLLSCPVLAWDGGTQAAEPAGPPTSPRVESLRLVIPDGGRVDWAVQGDLIAFDKRGSDGLYDLYLARPDGSNERCLTCPLLEFRRSHAYNPSWHPSGQLLAFQVQDVARKLGLGASEMSTPDRGLHSELWTISRDGEVFNRLSPANVGPAVLDPHFSHEGGLLAWSERVRSRKGRWGEWVVRVAQFDVRVEIPRLKKVETYRPGENRLFLECHGFTPDDRQLLVSGNLDEGQGENGMDLYLVDLANGKAKHLTQTLGEWDEHAHFAPDGKHLAWTNNRNLPRRTPPAPAGALSSARPIPRDLWLMRADGGGEERLTFFNHPAAPESRTGAVVADFAWSPDGDRIALHVVTDFAGQREAIYLLQLRPEAPPSEVRPPL